ncbi:Six-hairpin glycosidase-like protein [Aspergillus avenaceus]|uniref:Six-hairpin glycosidase-like protein n=1 Tax=Aspergillus avenaceus TaxID=36643 RepID=A0A5N6TQT5_ASPAV|nr:Six-hairpin glycosidase-like protein [Aspergillus avenaceus]
MKIMQQISYLLSLASGLGHATHHPKYSTWMLESVIARGEGINPADGLLGVIQKGLFQEALRAAIKQSSDSEEIAKWTDYHRHSVDSNIEVLLNATASSRDLPLDRLCVGRSIIEANLDTPLHREVLKSLRRSIDLQYQNHNSGFWYFVNPPAPFPPYGNLSYSDGMYGYAPFAALYGLTYNDPRLNIDSALFQLDVLYKHSIQQPSGLIKHGYDGSRNTPWADPITGASPIVWGRSLAWYLISAVDTLEIIQSNPSAKHTEEIFQGILSIFQRLSQATVSALQDSAEKTNRFAIWQVMDQPGEPENFVEASAGIMVAYALAKGVRLGYLSGPGFATSSECASSYLRVQDFLPPSTRDDRVIDVARAVYDDVVEHFVTRNMDDDTLDFEGTSVLASLHVEKLDYDYYTHRAVSKNSLIGTSAFVLAALEMELVDGLE